MKSHSSLDNCADFTNYDLTAYLQALLLKYHSDGCIHKKTKWYKTVGSKIGAWTITAFDVLISWLGGYSVTCNLLGFLAFPFHLATIIFAVILATAQALITIGSDVGDSKVVMGINLFSTNKAEALKEQIILTKQLYQQLRNKLKAERIAHHDLFKLLHFIEKNNQELIGSYHSIYKQKHSVAYNIGKWSLVAVSSLFHFGGGFFLGKSLLCVLGLSLIPSPVTIAIGVTAGILALTSFVILKRHIVIGNFNKLLGIPTPLPEKLNDYLFSNNGINKIGKELNKAINLEKSSYMLMKKKFYHRTKRKIIAKVGRHIKISAIGPYVNQTIFNKKIINHKLYKSNIFNAKHENVQYKNDKNIRFVKSKCVSIIRSSEVFAKG